MEEPYKGEKLEIAKPDYDIDGNQTWPCIDPYRPSKELIEAVKYARLLNRPLLLRGEPGCGKTKLAQAVAYELYGKDYRKYFFEWYVKSTTKAVDGLYSFDYLSRLHDSQSREYESKPLPLKEKYFRLGPLGQAFQSNRPSVILIDEVDKADIDFPNDLLLELDQQRFFVPELDGVAGVSRFEVKAINQPIVFITSNDERDLPNAFLRRCVFHYIEIGKEQWLEIVKARFARPDDECKFASLEEESLRSLLPLPNTEIVAAVDRFSDLVRRMKDGNATKVPDVSELLDWVRTIHHFWLSNEFKGEMLDSGKELLFAEVLLKNINDYKQFINKL